MTRLYLCTADSYYGDNLDLIVEATSAEEAKDIWFAWVIDWQQSDTISQAIEGDWKVWGLPEPIDGRTRVWAWNTDIPAILEGHFGD